MLVSMRRPSWCVFIAFVAPAACNSAPSAPTATPRSTAAEPKRADPVQATAARKKFGEPITSADALALSNVLAKPDDFANRTVTVEAKVRRNCTRRGCWMELSEGLDPTLPGCRVTFKDYGFFVPLDSAGSKAKVQGTVEVTQVGPDQVAHLESEGAHFAAKQPDGAAREVRLVASGVELWREP